jgi:glycosyltransferase involved in cell wall biosynthesis
MKLLVVSHPCVTPINQQLYAEVQRQTGWDLTLVGPSNWMDNYGKPRSLERWDTFEGTLIPIPVWPSGNIPLHVYKTSFIPLLRSLRPDAIYVHNEPYAASTAQVLLANYASSVRAPLGFYSAQNIHKTYPLPFRWTERLAYRAGSFAFPCSQTVSDTLQEKGFSGTATLLPLGIDPDLYRPSATGSALRAELAGEANVLFGYLGRLTDAKGLSTLIHALAGLPNDLSWRLAVVGSGDEEYVRSLKTLAADCGIADRIEWVGFVDHPSAPRYLSAFDVLAVPSETQPSWKEQFGRVIVEALACETPVVGSNSGEIPHLLGRTGGGVVVAERDPAALADGLLALARNPDRRCQLAVQGASYVRSRLPHRVLATEFARTVAHAARFRKPVAVT